MIQIMHIIRVPPRNVCQITQDRTDLPCLEDLDDDLDEDLDDDLDDEL